MNLGLRNFSCSLLLAVLFTACSKSVDKTSTPVTTPPNIVTPTPTVPSFISYLIKKGNQSAEQNVFKAVETQEMKFIVKFDSSAIYQTINPINQFDINKLYGFADNDSLHHIYSARFGWNWMNNALWLHGYVYNNTVLLKQTLVAVPIGQEINCSIKVNGSSYVFMVNGTTFTMPRAAKTAKGKGYQLYPYFGGDEFAPHDIRIGIKEL